MPDQRPALDTHFDAIAAELLREVGARLWRTREACCLGLADLFQVALFVSAFQLCQSRSFPPCCPTLKLRTIRLAAEPLHVVLNASK